ncbi:MULTISPECIES: carboxymuconolactone decarboxylase family protein [Thermomonospora]|uniref:AhpD family alkylhydroperoxidase n=1 Tax=Thermomonospora cellulosilytica TaxID=1411118 RepID=A0A7W3N186_9ACTN|nr:MULTISPECIES: carboxymuconolactone decarboxylase family protein [Thermomonospora]MBA9005614.1 AhpD family alkylhydroperoxidase [Thermomonospora cellulosilytica]
MSRMLARAARRGAQVQIRHVSAVPYGAAEGLAGAVYAQVEQDFGMLAPPVALHAPVPESLAACWMMLRETLLASGRVPRAVKETAAAAVSLGNTCPYCVEVHGTVLHGLASGRDATAVSQGRLASVADPRLREIAAWGMGGPSGGPAAPPGMLRTDAEAAELVGVAVTFHYLNRMVNVFLGDSPLPPGVPAALRGGARRLLARVMRAGARGRRPGRSLDLLPDAALPEDMRWAAGSPHVAGAFARAAAAFAEVGRRSVPESVRALLPDPPDGMAGENGPAMPSRAWVEPMLAGLPAADVPAGRLALLTARASYQVDRTVVDDFRRARPGDAALIGLTSWASFQAARAEGGRLYAGLKRDRPG